MTRDNILRPVEVQPDGATRFEPSAPSDSEASSPVAEPVLPGADELQLELPFEEPIVPQRGKRGPNKREK